MAGSKLAVHATGIVMSDAALYISLFDMYRHAFQSLHTRGTEQTARKHDNESARERYGRV